MYKEWVQFAAKVDEFKAKDASPTTSQPRADIHFWFPGLDKLKMAILILTMLRRALLSNGYAGEKVATPRSPELTIEHATKRYFAR